jgi:hypothetical protein
VRRVALRGLPPTVMFAVGSGRILLVGPLREVASNGNGAGGWPRAARNGKVEVGDLATGRLEASFRPERIVRSVALTSMRALVLVEFDGARTVESYDVRTGRRVRTITAPVSLRRLALDGKLVVLPLNDQVSVFDLATGRRWVVARTRFNTVGLSIRKGLVVRGEKPQLVRPDRRRARLLVCEPLRAQFLERLLALLEPVETHPGEDPVGLRELDVAVVHDLEVVSPRVAEVVVADHLRPGLAGGGERGLTVVDDETDVARLVRRLPPALREREELVAHVDERHRRPAPAQCELEDPAVEGECLVEVADLDRDVVDPDEPGHPEPD